MARVVAAARRLARPGDTVLLAPAAASMDVFRDYAHRGRRLRRRGAGAGRPVATSTGRARPGRDRRVPARPTPHARRRAAAARPGSTAR